MILLARPPGWDVVAVGAAALLPAVAILAGSAAARRAREADGQRSLLDSQRALITRGAAETSLSRAQLQRRLDELVALNELGAALSSTLDLDELLDRALDAVVHRLPFDRALVLLIDAAGTTLTGGRAIGGSPEIAALVADLAIPLDEMRSTFVQLARAEGPMVFRGVDSDPVRTEPGIRPRPRGQLVPGNAADHERPDGRDPRGGQPPLGP